MLCVRQGAPDHCAELLRHGAFPDGAFGSTIGEDPAAAAAGGSGSGFQPDEIDRGGSGETPLGMALSNLFLSPGGGLTSPIASRHRMIVDMLVASKTSLQRRFRVPSYLREGLHGVHHVIQPTPMPCTHTH